MTTVPYQGGREWPAFPAVRLQISGALGLHTVYAWGKIDTGASRTIVPTRILKQVGAYRHPRQVAGCKGYDGTRRLLPVYAVDLCVDDRRWPEDVPHEFTSTVVVGVSGGDDSAEDDGEILLGRDILAAWHLHLDGRSSHYTVT